MNLNSSIKATIAAATYVNAAAVRTLRQCLCLDHLRYFKSTTCSKARFEASNSTGNVTTGIVLQIA